MSTLPVYNQEVLPKLQLPLIITQRESVRYLGNRFLPQEITLSATYIAENKAEMDALYAFWRDDCKYGTADFTLVVDVLGAFEGIGNALTVSFIGDFQSTREVALKSRGTLNLLVKS